MIEETKMERSESLKDAVKCIDCEIYPVLMSDFETWMRYPRVTKRMEVKYYYKCMICGKETPAFSDKKMAKRFWNEANKEV